jgi:dTMP kinase|tara:strand:- start:17416 stop:18075 length:660 start_codon:yes stop_codon:yes gene_type:complete
VTNTPAPLRGKFISLEGGEGAGKSTQCELLASHLRKRGLDVVLTREPGGTPGAQAIRELVVSGAGDRWNPISEALLMYAARRDHVTRLIEPALAGGSWVVCDRFSDSTMAYQGYTKSLGRDWVETLDALVLGAFRPDLTLLLDIDANTGLMRAGNRGGPDRFEKLGLDFHVALREAFLDIARLEPDRIAIIQADQTIEAIARDIEIAVSQRLLSRDQAL